MAQPMRRKVSLSTSISPKIGQRIDSAMDEGGYASQSDLLQIALSEYFTRDEIRKHEEKMIKVYERLLIDDEGRKLIEEMPQDITTQIESLKKKGVACVELGDVEGATECFAKARELEKSISNELSSVATRRVVIE